MRCTDAGDGPGASFGASAGRAGSVRVLLASELRLVREAVAAALAAAGGFEVATVGTDVGDIARAAHDVEPAVLLLSPAQTLKADLRGPRLSIIGHVRDALPHIPVVMLGPAPSAVVARAALAEGAFAYVLKDEGLQDLVDAVAAAAEWRPHVGPVLRAWLDDLAGFDEDGVARLSAWEIDVLALLARGRTTAEIAAALHLSVRSIEASRARAFRLLGASGRADAVDAAIDLGLVL